MTWTFYNAQGQEKNGGGPPASIALDNWHVVGAAGEPAFQGLWKHYSASFQQVGFRKDAFGRVHLKGLLGCTGVSGNGTPIFVLPAGYRPPLTAVLDTSVPGTANNVRIDVQTDGVVLFNSAVSAMSATVFIDLDHLSFDTESVTTFPVGPQGTRGTRGGQWWVSGVTYDGKLVNVPADVVAPVQGDVFLYPDSADTFSYDGSVWVYTGPIAIGPALTTSQEGVNDFSATPGTYIVPNGTWGTPGWFAPVTVGPNQIWEVSGSAGMQCVTSVHLLSLRLGLRDNAGAALGAAYSLLRNTVINFLPSAITSIQSMQFTARFSTDATVLPGTVIRLVQEFLGGGANGRVIRDGTYYATWAWRRV